ncbi:MAG: NAD-dependent epimerase/dehydratase family protein, partial [Candidatus Limnocylindrus sp.]
MARVFLTGGSGFVGSHVLPALLAAGHEVVALARSPRAAATIAQRNEPYAARLTTRIGDVTNPASLPAALAGCDAIVHLVAIPRDWSKGADLLRINTAGTEALIAAASSAGIKRFVHLGALGVEDREELHYATSKARAERAVRE